MTSLAPTAYTALLTMYSQSDGEVQPSIVRYWWVFILIAILVFPVVLTAVLARIEKRLVWAYGSLEDEPQFDDVEGYGQRWVGDALKEGFHFLGWAPDLKGRIYQVCYAFLISPNRDHLIIVGMGSVLRIKVRGTWIYTIAANNKAICSTDNQACIHIDGARDWRTQLVSTNTFAGLLQSHKDLVQDLGFVPQFFGTGREVDSFKSALEERYQLMARSGLIAFMDGSSTSWQYTSYGALRFSVVNHFVALARKLTSGRIPRVA